MTTPTPSIIRGLPLEEESGLGTLTMSGWFAEVCAEHAHRDALVWYEGDERVLWTYADLWDRANEVARSLLALGIGKGTRVGVLMSNRPEFLSAVFGTALAGGVATTISTFSTTPELDHLLKASACSVLLLERSLLKKDYLDMLCELEPEFATPQTPGYRSQHFPYLQHIAVVGESQGAAQSWPEFLARGAAVDPQLVDATAAQVTPADPGALFFSSGTTALPKGILSAHRGVALQLWRWRRFYQTKEDARTWSANGFFWSGNFGMAIGGTLTAGGCLVLDPYFDPERALALMEREKATMAIAWPHQWPQLEAASNWLDVDLSSMIYVNPNFQLANHPTVTTAWDEPFFAYGNTETFTISSIFESGTPAERINGSSGEPQPGMVFKIVEPLTGELVPVGQEGEIAVKGPTLMLGYLGIPLDETLDDEGYFRTGDGGYVDDENRLYWKGRLNDIIKTGGANVSPREIDAALLRMSEIKLSQTVGIPHDTLGEIVVGCVVLHRGEALDEEALRTRLKAELASYKVPKHILFFDEAELETTGTAKIKTSELKEKVSARLNML
jgi:fatty-acyl-CoA synthase